MTQTYSDNTRKQCASSLSVDQELSSTSETVNPAVAQHEQVVASGNCNAQGPSIQVTSNFNFEYLRAQLSSYHDFEVVSFLQFGWPIGFTGSSLPTGIPPNHTGSTHFPTQIQAYLDRETKEGLVIGPFTHNPFSSPIALSPLNTVPKRDSAERRVILDLSYPEGVSVNAGIPRESYLGQACRLQYPSVDDLVEVVKSKGRGCLLFKRDLKRAYRQIPVDPGDINMLGFQWQGHLYFDRVLTMGLRSAAFICQRVTNAVNFILQNHDVSVVNYLDDFGGADTPDSAHSSYKKLGEVLQECGLKEAEEKACPPCTRMLFLGILFDTNTLTLEIDQSRIAECTSLFDSWMKKTHVMLKELQSLIGKIQFLSTCVRPGRIFLSRILAFLRGLSEKGVKVFKIPQDVKLDIKWWIEFLPRYNGVSMMAVEEWSEPDQVVASDACLGGCGGVSGDACFHSVFPPFISEQDLHINALEMLALMVCMKLWCSNWKGKRIRVLCDNQTSVIVLNTGRTRDPFLQACLREICMLAATAEFEVRARHIPGDTNRIPDLLSRWHSGSATRTEFKTRTRSNPLRLCEVEDAMFSFCHVW